MPSFEILAGGQSDTRQYQSLAGFDQQVVAEPFESDASFDRQNYAAFVLPIVETAVLLIGLPVILILIFRTERMQVKFEYQLGEAKKALARVDSLPTADEQTQLAEGTAVFTK